MNNAVKASVAGVLGLVLLTSGAGTLSTWSDTQTSAPESIQSGSLALGAVTKDAVRSTLSQRVPGKPDSSPVPYTGTAIVPGDVVTAQIDVPVTLDGQKLSAQFTVSSLTVEPGGSSPADAALATALRHSVTVVSIDGRTPDDDASVTLTRTGDAPATRTVRVVIEVALPWGAPGDGNETVGGRATITPTYTLTQILKGN